MSNEVTNPIKDAIEVLLSKDSSLHDLFKGKKRKELEREMERIAQSKDVDLMQIEVNKKDAESSNWFQSSWRPATAWLCIFALAYNFIIQKFLITILAIFNIEVVTPNLDVTELSTILIGLLGLGTFRTIEKIKNVTK